MSQFHGTLGHHSPLVRSGILPNVVPVNYHVPVNPLQVAHSQVITNASL